ncbi:Pr6Pr family membrane protein [Methylibium sp.]|uniref:Pr6Pr family membrane protein n=1 Tax=Methylibium sp. TaxID=2067992 RepID=UPI003BAC761C
MPTLLSAARAILAALALTAIGWQLMLHVGASYSLLNFFSYFTNLSNLFAVVVLLLGAFRRPSQHSDRQDVARYVSAVNMAVVGIVFVALLRNVDLGALLPWVNVVLHYVMPVAIVVDWVGLQAPASPPKAWHLALALVFPAVYLVYVLLRGAAIGWYPYPFLDPANVGGYGGVALYAAGIFGTFLGAGWALLALASSGILQWSRRHALR